LVTFLFPAIRIVLKFCCAQASCYESIRLGSSH
jgi:hypothetical protein